MKISLNVWMSILSYCLKPTEVGGCQGLFYDVAACLRMRNCNVLNLVCWFQSSDYCIVYRYQQLEDLILWESFFSQMNECHSEVLIPWVSVLVWYNQWVFRFFVTSRVCSPNTYSFGLIHSLSFASRASHICRKSKRAH